MQEEGEEDEEEEEGDEEEEEEEDGVKEEEEDLDRFIETVLQADANVQLRVGGFERHELPALRLVEGDGFFAEDVDALPGAPGRHRIVQPVRQADMDAVGSFRPHHLLIVGIKRDAGVLFFAHRPLFGVRVTQRAQGDLRVGRDGGQMDGGNVAQADHCCFFHGLFRLRRRGAGRALWQGAPRGAVTVCPRYSRTGNLPSAAMRLFSSAA